MMNHARRYRPAIAKSGRKARKKLLVAFKFIIFLFLGVIFPITPIADGIDRAIIFLDVVRLSIERIAAVVALTT